MPKDYTKNIFFKLPRNTDSEGASSKINNENFESLDIHNHSTGKGKAIKSSGVNVDEDLSFQNNSIRHLSNMEFEKVSYAVNLDTIPNGSIFLASDGFFRYKDSKGRTSSLAQYIGAYIIEDLINFSEALNTIYINTRYRASEPATPAPVVYEGANIPEDLIPSGWRKFVYEDITGTIYESQAIKYNNGDMIFSRPEISAFSYLLQFNLPRPDLEIRNLIATPDNVILSTPSDRLLEVSYG